MIGRRKKYRKRPTSDTGLGSSSIGAETRRSEEVRFSAEDDEAESNLSDCFGFSHEKRVRGLSCSLVASTDMRGTMRGAGRRKRNTEGNHMDRRRSVYFYLVHGKSWPIDHTTLTAFGKTYAVQSQNGSLPSWPAAVDNRNVRIGNVTSHHG